LQFIAAETAQDLPGSAAIVDRLAEVLFVQAMRSRIQSSLLSGSPSWLRALGDSRIGEALRLMHLDPERTPQQAVPSAQGGPDQVLHALPSSDARQPSRKPRGKGSVGSRTNCCRPVMKPRPLRVGMTAS